MSEHREKAVEAATKYLREVAELPGPRKPEEAAPTAAMLFTLIEPHLQRMYWGRLETNLDLDQLRSELQRIAEGRMTLDSTEILTWAEGWLLTLAQDLMEGEK